MQIIYRICLKKSGIYAIMVLRVTVSRNILEKRIKIWISKQKLRK